MEALLSYLIVAGVAFLVTFAELFRSFGGGVRFVFHSVWTWSLVALNVGFALVTYTIATAWLNIGSGPVFALICGMLFLPILRSRFTFFRPVGKKDISVPLDEMYTAIQTRCLREVDSHQAARRVVEANQLAGQTEEAAFVGALKVVISARQVVVEKERDEGYLEELLQIPDADVRRRRLALFLIDIAGGQADELLSQERKPT